MNRIEILLKQYGPMLSGDLAKKYEKKYNASNEAARKAISRARSPIQKIKYFPFEKNQIFCYLEEQYNTSSYKKMLYSSLKKHSSTIAPLWNYIQKLICNLFQFTHQENQRTSSVFKKHS